MQKLIVYKVILSWCSNGTAISCSDYFRCLDDGSVTSALRDPSVTFRTCDFRCLDDVSPVSSVESSIAVHNY